MRESIKRPQVRTWLAVVGAISLTLGACYAMVQQSNRLTADDLPLSTSQTVQKALAGGADPNDVVPSGKIDLSSDSNVFVIITDSSKHILASSANLNGKSPLPPSGVFDYTNAHSTDHFTWQPAKNVRLATRVVTYKNANSSGYIITGQSLKQAEDRISTFGILATVTWIAAVAWASAFILWPIPIATSKKTK